MSERMIVRLVWLGCSALGLSTGIVVSQGIMAILRLVGVHNEVISICVGLACGLSGWVAQEKLQDHIHAWRARRKCEREARGG